MKNKLFEVSIIILGSILIIFSWNDYNYKNNIIRYSEAVGKIIKCEIDMKSKNRRWIFEYEYYVDNYRYSNSTIGYGFGNAKDYKNIYEGKIEIIVYYNINNPKESVLLKEVSKVYLIPAFIGFIIIFLGLFSLFSTKNKYLNDLNKELWG
jgi:hypothetical protein